MNGFLLSLIGVALLLASVLCMADPVIPTPQDKELLLEDTTTKTVSYNSASHDFGSGYAPGGLGQPMGAVINVTARDFTTGDETYTVAMQESADNSTFTACGPAVTISATGVATCTGRLKQRYCRLAFTLGGTTPSITFKAWLNPIR